ncbi:carbohydrate ABC transporter permease [Microbacterium sediminis]|uniref:Glycerol-3-phosphate ABC transporter permease n=1 Tax=Microbacterium sediminis TaxID=904291 RepID=A0A1B9NAA9_9MICO|nr:carbohydrate ABC transporter permease [Microbacterium sediminis]OCG73526.1 glycerol-3-phosphate ABC transporter permease [Microbacterium sediminis]QBR73196.1 carbohydrate ABC transporter permease [Microbacterium sediminis]
MTSGAVRTRSRAARLLGDALGGYLPLVVATLIVALPLIWMILGSLKSPAEIITQDLVVLPSNPSLDAYADASARIDFARLTLNSTIVTVVGGAIKVVLALTTAYALVFVQFPFKRLVFGVILVALMVPAQVALVPNYVLIAGMGGVNTYWGIILPGLGTAFGTFLLRQQFLALPKEIVEAAEMDGAGHVTRLFRVIVPVTTPTIATVALVTVVNEWNDYLWPLIVTNSGDMMTLPVGLSQLSNSEGDLGQYPMLMAGAVVVIVPVLILFAFLQRYIVAGLTQGAVR